QTPEAFYRILENGLAWHWIPPVCGARFILDQYYRKSTKITQAKLETIPDLQSDISWHSTVDVLLLCLLAVVLTTAAFLKFFRSDI
ncbi:hypothetical protein J4G07_20545, partial [Candidatus Poribacteria bacterium]|nr:hypothetical protein [Candidatus Poribacteria bacterium]